jgi:hypothetical protein
VPACLACPALTMPPNRQQPRLLTWPCVAVIRVSVGMVALVSLWPDLQGGLQLWPRSAAVSWSLSWAVVGCLPLLMSERASGLLGVAGWVAQMAWHGLLAGGLVATSPRLRRLLDSASWGVVMSALEVTHQVGGWELFRP